jgi:hypothetical protein
MQTSPALILIQITKYANLSCFAPYPNHGVFKFILRWSSFRLWSMQTSVTLILIQITKYANLAFIDPHQDHGVCKLILRWSSFRSRKMQTYYALMLIHADHGLCKLLLPYSSQRSRSMQTYLALILIQILEYATLFFFYPNPGIENATFSLITTYSSRSCWAQPSPDPRPDLWVCNLLLLWPSSRSRTMQPSPWYQSRSCTVGNQTLILI